ncbi:RNA-dependent RNA polymerase [Natranaerovirga pectinivora]|uniref:RNA-dependent RNA polymerase n=1 Tax=Natranaerovirga pectinivora TaxID=682400 RepID=A0A4R3MTI3_9FIRM|nr:hypothetical protein [Natranaerovirga pectinivora]TCT16374.1 RNA-dependent RNA polymerase [Natranaerovirga pectinivora]
MAKKRLQYKIRQFNLKTDIAVKDDKFYLNENVVSYSMSENIVFDLVYRLQNREYIHQWDKENGNPNDIPELFYLKHGIDKDNDEQVSAYNKVVKNGLYIGEQKFVYAEKSAAMSRTQKTLYIREDLQPIVEEYITLGKNKTINKTIPSKWLTTRGLMLSSALLIDKVPRIAIIPDFEKNIREIVQVVEEFTPTTATEKEEYAAHMELAESEDRTNKKVKEKLKEIRDDQKRLKGYSIVQGGSVYKSETGWEKEGKRIKLEEVNNFKYVGKYKEKYHPKYTEEQTEEIKEIPINKYSLGYKLNVGEMDNTINCFDGMGLVSFEFMQQIEKEVGEKNINGCQLRLNYLKGLFVKFDFKKYLKEVLKTDTITDIFGGVHNIDDLDIIATESCFKAKLQFEDDGVTKKWLFNSLDEYYQLLDKYGFKKLGIANYAKNNPKKYTPLSYQALNGLGLDVYDMAELSKVQRKVIDNVLRRGDVVNVKLLLDIIEYDSSENQEEIETKLDYVKKLIEINEELIFDKEIQNFLYKKSKQLYKDLMIGRIRVPSQNLYITGDIIAFMEWAAYRDESKVKGFLGRNEFSCEGVEGEQVMIRYPLTHPSEVNKGNFVKSNNEYLEHLHNVIQVNCYDLTADRMSGCDFDGDKISIFPANMEVHKGKKLGDYVKEDYIQVNPADKATAKAVKFDFDAIWQLEEATMQDLTGKITNIGTTLQELSFLEDNKSKYDLGVRLTKHFQGVIIDAVKSGLKVEIPNGLKKYYQKPYYFKYIDGTPDYKLLSHRTPLGRFCFGLEKEFNKYFPIELENKQNKIGLESKAYLDCVNPHTILINEKMYDRGTMSKLIKELMPIHNNFSTKKGEIDKEMRKIGEGNSQSIKDERKLIQAMYGELYECTRNNAIKVANKICGNEEINSLYRESKELKAKYLESTKEEQEEIKKQALEIKEKINKINEEVINPSILASACVTIAYELSKNKNEYGINQNKNHLFPWIVAPYGLLENAKEKENKIKTNLKLVSLPENIQHVDKFRNILDIDGKRTEVHKVEDKTYATNIIEKEIYINKKSTSCIDENYELPLLKDYECKIWQFMVKDGARLESPDIRKKLADNNVVIKLKDNIYPAIYVKDDYIGSIHRQSSHVVGGKIEDYVGKEFKINNIRGNAKSYLFLDLEQFEVTLSD